jgi:hypothetical protein
VLPVCMLTCCLFAASPALVCSCLLPAAPCLAHVLPMCPACVPAALCRTAVGILLGQSRWAGPLRKQHTTQLLPAASAAASAAASSVRCVLLPVVCCSRHPVGSVPLGRASEKTAHHTTVACFCCCVFCALRAATCRLLQSASCLVSPAGQGL